jgi:hypothetical protein
MLFASSAWALGNHPDMHAQGEGTNNPDTTPANAGRIRVPYGDGASAGATAATMDANCPLKTLTGPAPENQKQVDFSKKTCESESLSDTNITYSTFHMTWGPPGQEFSADILPLAYRPDPSQPANANRGILSYYKAGAHKPGISCYYPQDAAVCDPRPNEPDSKKYICPRERVVECKEGKLWVITPAPDNQEWEVHVSVLGTDKIQSMALGNPLPADGGESPTCFISGQIPPTYSEFSLYPKAHIGLSRPDSAAPASPSTPAAPTTPDAGVGSPATSE